VSVQGADYASHDRPAFEPCHVHQDRCGTRAPPDGLPVDPRRRGPSGSTLYLRVAELQALQKPAERSGRGVGDLVRDAIRRGWLPPPGGEGAVALWSSEPRRTAGKHGTLHDGS
jgi:hypothetical protein